MNKSELIQKSKEHEEAIESEVREIVSEGQKMAKTAAIVAGGLLATYFVIRLVTKKKVVISETSDMNNIRPVKSAKASMFSGIGKIILTELAMMGISMAKERFKDILHDEKADTETN